MEKKEFSFSTKATTLAKLQGALQESEVPPLLSFTVQEWDEDPKAIYERVANKFSSTVVVRSSALNEDGYGQSMAGSFESVLDVPSQNQKEFCAAVEKVIESYGKKDSLHHKNQVLVQEQVGDVQMSGVIFTQDLETGAPYYVINYDDYSGRTDTITSGTGDQQKIFTYCKLFNRLPSDSMMALLVTATKEIEEKTGHDSLDIEFVVSGDKFHTIQVRPIATIKDPAPFSEGEFKETLDNLKTFLGEQFRPFPNVTGKTTAFGIMPDWNPAEIIGVDPKPLAFSLYRYLITDYIWPLSRRQVGYRDVGHQPGICSLAGKPYVDVRMSFNTFTPASISDATAEKLIDTYIRKLRYFQDFHDKVEFKVVYSCYRLDIEEIEEEMRKNKFSEKEIAEVRTGLFKITDDIIEERVTSIAAELKLADEMSRRRKKIVASDIDPFVKIAQLGHDCREFGTLPFSKLARFAFMGLILMRSLKKKNIISQEEYDLFFASIKTVATNFLDRIGELKKGAVSKQEFLKEFGHLRPGTYDVGSKTYAEGFDKYIDLKNFTVVKKNDEFVFSTATKKLITEELAKHGFKFDAEKLLRFVRDATAAREKAKFEFTKNLSLILTLIEEAFAQYNIPKEDLAFLKIDDILRLSQSSLLHNTLASLQERIKRSKEKYQLTKLIRLPPVIFLDRTVQYFNSTDVMPNYITQKTMTAEIVDLSKGNGTIDLKGKIVLIANADPGYDWIFSHDIAGLITEFGGAASHMAIRAAEFKLPAAIGCGSTLFAFVKGCKKIMLDCASKQIKAVMQ